MLFSTPQRAALISVASNTLLVAAKIVVAVLSGSAALLSEALHSGLDLLASLIAWLSLRFAAHPPDREHPYGHGKWENVSAFLEGLLILGVALWVFYEAGQRLFTPVALTHVSLGMAVLGGSALVNLLVSQALRRAARRFDSVALEADAAHLSTDVYTSVGALAGLGGYFLTGYPLFDTGAAFGVGAIICAIGIKVTHGALHGLLDTRLPVEEEEVVREIVSRVTPVLELKEIVSRKAGPVRYLDLTLTVCRWETLEEIHRLCDDLEDRIADRFPGARVFIHPEPCLIHRDTRDAETCDCPLRLNISYPVKD
ncbi:MAG: cation diffusion facilitator family transporter [Syntrophobacterales bacterium]|jgi:cation diffusion facilitator family transporter